MAIGVEIHVVYIKVKIPPVAHFLKILKSRLYLKRNCQSSQVASSLSRYLKNIIFLSFVVDFTINKLHEFFFPHVPPNCF